MYYVDKRDIAVRLTYQRLHRLAWTPALVGKWRPWYQFQSFLVVRWYVFSVAYDHRSLSPPTDSTRVRDREGI